MGYCVGTKDVPTLLIVSVIRVNQEGLTARFLKDRNDIARNHCWALAAC